MWRKLKYQEKGLQEILYIDKEDFNNECTHWN